MTRVVDFLPTVPLRFWVWMLVLTVAAVGLCFVPLFNVLGYEFSWAMAVLISLAAADLSAAWIGNPRLPPSSVWSYWLQATWRSTWLLLPPLLVIQLNALRIPPCDVRQGLLFYALLPVLSVPLATAVGVLCRVVLLRHPILAIGATWFIVLGSLGVALWRIYSSPQIFAYGPFFGYFPGALYDEHITLGPAFYASRLFQYLVCLSVLCVASTFVDKYLRWNFHLLTIPLGTRHVALGLAVLFVAGAGIVYSQRAALGFVVCAHNIAEALGGRKETAHFVIYYPRGASFAHQMDAIAQEHEFRYAQIVRVLEIPGHAKITSFYFASATEKKRWTGAAQTYIAKPWRHEIYLHHDDFPHPTLGHEIAHVVAAAFGDPVLGVSVKWLGWPPFRFNMGLIEGLAVALDWSASRAVQMTPHQLARTLLDHKMLPPIRRILAPIFYLFSSAQGYAIAGSFVHHLLTTQGPQKLAKLYRTGGTPADVTTIYGVPLEALEQSWHQALRATPLSAAELALAAEHLRRPAVFSRRCAHLVAEIEERIQVLQNRGDREQALALLRRLCAQDIAEPTHVLALAAMLVQTNQAQEAATWYEKLTQNDVLGAPFKAQVFLGWADLAAHQGDFQQAHQWVTRALALPTDTVTQRALRLRRYAYDTAQPGTAALVAYLLGQGPYHGPPDPVVLLHHAENITAALPTQGLGFYLQGRLLLSRGGYFEAAHVFAQAEERGLGDRIFQQENRRLWVRAAFLAGDLLMAHHVASLLRTSAASQAEILEAQDWWERLAFAQLHAT